MAGKADKDIQSTAKLPRRFVSEKVIAELTGRKPQAFQQDRFFGRSPFPYYRIGGRHIRYDLDEVLSIIVAGRTEGKRAA